MGPEIIAAAAIASTAFAAYGQIQQGQQQAAIAGYNAQVDRQQADLARSNAQAERDAAAADAEDIRRRGSRVQGSLRAAAGAAGLVSDQGSPYELLLENAQEIELEAQRRLFKGEVDARKQLAASDRYAQEATLDTYRGSTAATTGYLQAGASLLEGGVKAYRILGTKTPTTGGGATS